MREADGFGLEGDEELAPQLRESPDILTGASQRLGKLANELPAHAEELASRGEKGTRIS